ncbi:hypothetical protein ACFFIF_01230 [Vagococcus entomophilus]|uniref:DUF5085 domain-containing protein n=1 Tax=Vagococcus entomophilus TaxID=1160095 RepID=A0A430AKH0_9ENTE|nr:hypothetical protein [Vagococcus entomophilus]RSU08559.1 hypothetical protein CBF30_04830 [Vagococcus entomophilus]
MKIDRSPLIMQNLIRFQAIMKEDEWEQGFELLKNLEYAEGVYQNGPTLFSMEKRENEPEFKKFEFFMPVNVPLQGNENAQIDFVDELVIPDAMMMRHADSEPNLSYVQDMLEQEAKKIGVVVEKKAYCICLDVFNEVMIDVYMPIKNGGES